MLIRTELIDELLKDHKKPDDLFGKEGILKQLTKALIEKCLETELEVHPEKKRVQEKETPKSRMGQRNRRNSYSPKTVKGEFGKTRIQVPRDKNSESEPTLVPKGETRIPGMDEKIISLYAGGMTTKDRKALAADLDLKAIYGATTLEAAEQALVDFGERWDESYPAISKSWLTHWERVTPFFTFPEDIRKAIYTTNTIKSMNMTLRKVSRHRRSFPSDESALKLIFLPLGNLSKKWTMPIRNWKAALNHFAIEFEGRFPL